MKIFVSYSSKNKPTVEGLVKDLTILGHQVWFDQALTGGKQWWEDILAHIRQCDLFVFVLSNLSLASYPCQLEYTYAYDLQKRILPILIEPVDFTKLPPPLAMIQVVDYTQADRQAALKLSAALT
jgi:hypothetical protein